MPGIPMGSWDGSLRWVHREEVGEEVVSPVADGAAELSLRCSWGGQRCDGRPRSLRDMQGLAVGCWVLAFLLDVLV